MSRPLLYLLHRGDRPSRIRAVTDLMARLETPDRDGGPMSWSLLILSTGIDLAAVARKHPRLTRLLDQRGGKTSPLSGSGVALSDHPRLLVVGAGIKDAIPAILGAMAGGVLVMIPDEGMGATLVRDGINGFHYRAGDPDSLALSLLSLEWLPANLLQAILDRARATFNAACQGLPAGLAAIQTGESA